MQHSRQKPSSTSKRKRTIAPDEAPRDWRDSTFLPALASGLVLFAAFPPLDLFPLAWVAPIGWLLLVRRPKLSGRRSYGLIYLAGVIHCLATLQWVSRPHWSAAFGLLALALYIGVYTPAFIGLTRVAVHRCRMPLPLAAPVVWMGLELVRGHFLGGFGFALLGHTQWRVTPLIQISDLAGAYGVGFLVMLVAACITVALPRDGRPAMLRPLIPGVVVVVAALVYGYIRIDRPAADPIATVALIQGAVDTEFGGDAASQARRQRGLLEYELLSLEAVRKHPKLDLIIWPESMFRHRLVTHDDDARPPAEWEGNQAEFVDRLVVVERTFQKRLDDNATQRAFDTPMLVGMASADHWTASGVEQHNTALLIGHDGTQLDRYDKMQLVMFGEFVPLGDWMPWLYDLTPLSGGLTPGREPKSMSVGSVRYAPSICFESSVPHAIGSQVRTLIEQGEEPDVLVNLTNDGWFWGNSLLDLHLTCSVFRAVECRKPVLVAANTGFSASIDGSGRILQQGPRRKSQAIIVEIRPDDRQSWYLIYGDLPAGLCLAVCVVLLLVGIGQKLRSRCRPRQDAAQRE
ncbi:MAG: apolipoprotein N-acyltransferase [Planctomycetes bacterium]|nr:apolipoprotein N-acyltransferase [Planctomycetota bacterium]